MSSEVNGKFPSMEKTISEQGVDIVVFIVSPIIYSLYGRSLIVNLGIIEIFWLSFINKFLSGP